MQFNVFFACGGLFSVLLLHSSFPFVRLFRSYFVPLFLSSDFSVPLLFLFSALQTFPFLFVPLFRSSDFSARISFLFSVLLSARHFLDGGVFRSIGNFFVFCFVFVGFGGPGGGFGAPGGGFSIGKSSATRYCNRY